MYGQSPPMPLGVSMVEALLITLSAPLLVLVALWGAHVQKIAAAMCSKPAACRGCCLQRIKGKPFRFDRLFQALSGAPATAFSQPASCASSFLRHAEVSSYQTAIKRTFQ